MTTIQEKMAERMKERPDDFTPDFWVDQFDQVRKGYSGLTHAVNCVLARIEDQNAAVKEMGTLVDAQADVIREANIAIGKLQLEMTELKASLEKAREAYKELNGKIGK